MDPEDIKKLLEEQKTVWAEFKKTNDANKEQSGQALEKLDKLNTRLDQIETKFNRENVNVKEGENNEEKISSKYKDFKNYIKKGIVPEGTKVLVEGDDSLGGFLAPAEFVQMILKTITEFSPVRSVAWVRKTNRNEVMVPTRTGQFAAKWTNEVGTRNETTGLTWGMEKVPVHEHYALVNISMQNLEDSAFNLEAELQFEFGEQFAVIEGTAFVNGTAVGQPEGILTNTDIGTTESATSGAVTADELFDIFYSLKDFYTKNANWMMKRETIGKIRKLKDADNQYLWQPGLQGGQPSRLLDKPIIEATDVPVVTGSSKSIIFGDFFRGYLIVDRIELTVLRDEFTSKKSGQIEFLARRRVGGQVVQAEALKIYTIKA